MNVIDLFSGCGGLSWGFEKSGFNIKKALEFDSQIAFTYRKNYPNVDVLVDDIKNVDTNGIFCLNDADVIIGGPPCQGFSMAGARIRNGFINDPRNYLFKHYFNIVKNVRPKAFVIENVKGIQTMKGGDIFREILNIFSSDELLGDFTYRVFYRVLDATDFGVPQKRQRMIIIGILNTVIDKYFDFSSHWDATRTSIFDEDFSFFDYVTIRDAIDNLPEPTSSGVIPNPKPHTNYQKYLACNDQVISNHMATTHSNLAISRMGKVRPGENFTSLNENITSVHSGSYGRMVWDEPSVTITTRFDTPAGGRFTHPNNNRTITPREAARIQSFPDEFVFYGNRTSVCKQIGNAVPPKVSYFLAKLISNILED